MAASYFILDEGVCLAACLFVRKLLRRRFHEIARGTRQRSTDPSIHRKLCTANGVDDHAGGIWRVPDFEPYLGAQRYATKRGALETDVGELAIGKPGDVVTGADVHIIGFQGDVELAGNGLRLGYLL